MRNGVGFDLVGFEVVPNDLAYGLVRFIGVRELEIEHRVDLVLALERTETVLQTVTGEDRAFVGRGLAVEVESGAPPVARAVFEFGLRGPKGVATARQADDVEAVEL